MIPALALPLRGVVVYPGMVRTLPVGRPASVAAIDRHAETGEPLVLVPQLDVDEEDPLTARIATHGTSARLLRSTRLPDGTLRALVEGIEVVRLAGPMLSAAAGLIIDTEPVDIGDPSTREVAGHATTLADLARRLATSTGLTPADHELVAATPAEPDRLAWQVAGQIPLPYDDRIALLEEPSLLLRLERISYQVAVQLEARRIEADVQGRVQEAMDNEQREYHLRQQLKALRAELGDAHGAEADAARFEARIETSNMPEEIKTEAMREVERLRNIHSDSSEYTIARTWLETLVDLPWSIYSADTPDLKIAEEALDEEHHGLEKVKERILEYLAVRQLQPNSKGPILCFVGPPGVGKTSLGQTIAKALGRSYGRIALGGIKDETEIRGHRRTYVGALPGRIIRALIRAESSNPVLVLDEIDKLGADFRGDPASALLEVLDPEQNVAFVDHYVDQPFDLSQVLFIATANLIDPIPPALMDRLEVIELPGYTEEEKVAIAQAFLVPRMAASHGLADQPLTITRAALERIIRDYTREAGLRELERKIATIHRKVARQVVEGRTRAIRITEQSLKKYLGPKQFHAEVAERVDQPGVVTGLAWTAAGGDILFIEAIKMKGVQGLKLTGSLGDVMKESAEAALSWLRANLEVDASIFDAAFHLHVPAGAIPKDGPSAGVTMVTALASLVTGRPVRPRLAMTGEITLRGKVLPVGGVKEKVLAARRAGIQTVILPRHNESDLEDIPAVLRRDLKFQFADTVREVLELALEPAQSA